MSQFLNTLRQTCTHTCWPPYNPFRLISWWSEVKVAQSCLTLCDSVNCGPPGSSVHGILQARIWEWVAIPFSRSSWPRNETWVPFILGTFFTIWSTSKLIKLFKRVKFIQVVEEPEKVQFVDSRYTTNCLKKWYILMSGTSLII